VAELGTSKSGSTMSQLGCSTSVACHGSPRKQQQTVYLGGLNKAVLTKTVGASIRKSKKGKAVPLQAWSGPEGSRKLRFPDYMTTAQDGGKVVSLTHWPPLPPGNARGTHFC
jgi:hypothetical protein